MSHKICLAEYNVSNFLKDGVINASVPVNASSVAIELPIEDQLWFFKRLSENLIENGYSVEELKGYIAK